ncbi:MAG: aldehyde dehydrogenase [Sphingobium sp.]|nr:MAG: aldehyde dehydrogenase [Sphingobium sp.]
MTSTVENAPNDLQAISERQKHFYNQGLTRDVDYRIQHLKRLKNVLLRYEDEICDALHRDFRKPVYETELSEFLIVLLELKSLIKNCKSWAKPRYVLPSLVNFPSVSKIYKQPFGGVLIIAPWNYPFQLVMAPLIAAIAAGNTAVVKPSELTPNTASVLEKIIAEVFEPGYVDLIQGDAQVAKALLNLKWDYIFFTGSSRVGKIVYEAAAKHLTPVTLELGGKNPCIVDGTAPLELSAKRIVWGKIVNAGQTCIAPDYLLVEEGIKDKLLLALKTELQRALDSDPKKSPDYARIINNSNFKRLKALLEDQQVRYGGDCDASENYIAPTILDMGMLGPDTAFNELPEVLQDEIFGPILPVLTYKNQEDVQDWIEKYDKPLAVYLFSKNKKLKNKILNELAFGGGVINDVVSQFLNPRLPFGGVGSSGLGAYHGKHSFDTFSHKKSMVYKATWIDLNIRYAPYSKKLKMFKRLRKYF